MAVLPLEAVTTLQNMLLLPAAVMPQVGSRPRLIINFTWSGLNDIAERLAPMEAMHFGGALLRILKQVVTADLFLGPVYLGKVDLVGAYMRLWVSMEDVPSVAFLIPKNTPATHIWQDSTSPSPWGTSTVPPIFEWLQRRWLTSQTRLSTRGSM